MIKVETPCEGWYSLSAYKVDAYGVEIPGTRRSPVPPFKNLITDSGLERMGESSDWLTWCQVGSGATAPAFGDTALVSRVAGTSTKQDTSTSVQPSAPYYVSRRNTFRFAAGAAAGNLSEVGVGWASTAGLFSRALILDALGSPTTITVLADETLDVTYEFREYMPSVDGAGSVVLRGDTYDVVSRAAAVTTSADSVNQVGWLLQSNGTSAGTAAQNSVDAGYTGAIGAVTGTPSGSLLSSTSISVSPYSAASLARDFVLFFGNSEGNDPAGIGSIRIRLGIGVYQFGFTPAIPKTSDDTLTLTFRHSWARKTL